MLILMMIGGSICLRKLIFRFLEVQPSRRILPFTETLVDGLFDPRKVISKSPIQVI